MLAELDVRFGPEAELSDDDCFVCYGPKADFANQHRNSANARPKNEVIATPYLANRTPALPKLPPLE